MTMPAPARHERSGAGPELRSMPRPAVDADARPRLCATRAWWVGLLTAAYLIAIGGMMPVINDSSRDRLLARDGLASGVFIGSPTSFP